MSILRRRFLLYLSCALFASVLSCAKTGALGVENLDHGFAAPPDDAKPRVYWFWIYNHVDKAGITRDLEQFKAKGISGVWELTLSVSGRTASLATLTSQKKNASPKTHDAFRFDMLTKTTTPIESGLLGPVTLQRDEE